MSPDVRKAHAAVSEGGALTFDGAQGVFIPRRMLAALTTALRQVSGVPPVAIYDWGLGCGREVLRGLREEAPGSGARFLIDKGFARFSEYGWGLLQVREFHPDEGRLVAESPNPINVDWLAYTETKGPRTEDHFTRGFVAGVVSEALGRDVEGIEAACRAKGAEICVFQTHAANPRGAAP